MTFLKFVCSAYDCTIPARGKGIAKTDLSISIPNGTYARVAPRSGLAVKHFIDTGAGVVDEDYRGNVGVVLFNHGETDFTGEQYLQKFRFKFNAAVFSHLLPLEVTFCIQATVLTREMIHSWNK